MKDLFMEGGYVSINKHDQPVCGDFYTTVKTENGTTIVLSDGLGSGVKANILATLTAKILSTMMARKLPISQCIRTMADTLPVCKVRKMAYSTFTILQLDDNRTEAYLAQFDNPPAILLRAGKNFDYERSRRIIGGKEISESVLRLAAGDFLILFSDGVTNAGLGKTMLDGWPREDIIKHLEDCYAPDLSPQQMAATLAEACMDLDLGSPDDDITIIVYKLRKRQAVNVLIGPPAHREDDESVMRMFFSKEGRHIVCGGTTAQAASRYLRAPVVPLPDTGTEEIPAAASIKGIDLVTEGVITLGKVLEIAQEYTAGTRVAFEIKNRTDGASLLARMLFEEATDINLFVGRAENKAHERLDAEIGFPAKMGIIKQIQECLLHMGKNVKLSMC
ncbi:MAG: PP2C family protein-serine/threonine phosphatase [Anaerotruncus rubiinfantis]|jgi:hypothetical protein|uniref:PP2C family protein-serine/threonine phosphatase n=1 Tax=Anaerotruncus rubiinfantis TaxID=1720200 RepID=UPI001896F86E|nr:PP2C family protein-serine/threonine phosphatase [Anaerotruncus rubiinfantis]